MPSTPNAPEPTSLEDVRDAASPADLPLGGMEDPRTHITERVARHQAALLEFMKGGVLAQSQATVFSALTELTARTLGVARVSIWRFSDDSSTLILEDIFDGDARSRPSTLTLAAVDYPAYFEALNWNRVLSISDARLDPRTNAFEQGYLLPLGIVSMLDAGIWISGGRYGVVCAEAIGTRREWEPDEQLFVASVADLAAIAIENETRRTAQTNLSVSEDRFGQVFRLSPDLMVITRMSDGVVLEVNDGFERQTGYASSEVIGKTTDALNLWAIPKQREAWLALTRTQGNVRGMEADLRRKSGEIRTYQMSSELTTFDGQPCMISISRDFTETKRESRLVFEIAQGVAASTGESFFRSLVEHLARALDADMAFVGEVQKNDSSRVETIAARGRDGPLPAFSYDLDGSPCQTILGGGVCAYPRDVCRLFPKDKALVDKAIQGYVGAPLLDSAGHKLGLIAVLFKRPIEHSDMAVQLLRIFAIRAAAELERRDQLVELKYRASHDQLTGLQNRATLERHVDESIKSGRCGSRATLLLLDVARIREINDTLGHSVGDRLIANLAQRLRDENRMGCIRGAQLARLGGVEFAIWMTDISSAAAAMSVARFLRDAISTPFEIEGYRLEVDASIGVASYPDNADTASTLLRCADIAMYQAKQHGGGVVYYDRSTDPYSPQRLVLMGQLGNAVRGGQLEVYYQPRIHLQKRGPAGFEALVRWQHPDLGLLPPSQFIPLAELSDVIRPLTFHVMDEALRQTARWNAIGMPLAMGVNLSARMLMDNSCAEHVLRLIEKHAVDPSQLELEVTESAIIADPDRARDTLTEIHKSGVRISIDDFGTGFSSLSHLKRLPLNALKIDVSFVTHMLSNDQDAAIVSSTIGLAHSLGLSVVAEGIEDAATEEHLRELGCEEGQGFHIARPMPSDDTSAWLRQKMH